MIVETILAYVLKGSAVAIVVPCLGAAIYYLLYWAKITRFLWSRYSDGFSQFMRCAACSGFWYALFLGLAAWGLGLPFFIFPGLCGEPAAFAVPGLRWLTPLLIGLWGLYWIPRLARKLLDALQVIGDHVSEKDVKEAPLP